MKTHDSTGQVCLGCAATSLCDPHCACCLSVVNYTHLALNFVKASQALEATKMIRRGVTFTLIQACFCMLLLRLGVPAFGMVVAICVFEAAFQGIGFYLVRRHAAKLDFMLRRDLGVSPSTPITERTLVRACVNLVPPPPPATPE